MVKSEAQIILIEGITVSVNSSSPYPNINSLTIRRGGRLNLNFTTSPNLIADTAPIYLDAGTLWFAQGGGTTSEKVDDFVLSGGKNELILYSPPQAGSSFGLSAKGIMRDSPNATLVIGMSWDGTGQDVYSSMGMGLRSAPDLVNNIMPYSVIRVSWNNNWSGWRDYYFTTGIYSNWNGGVWSIAEANASPAAQASWNSTALNVSISANQTLTANRSINSLRLVDNHTINLNGYTLSVNAGAFLSAREGRAQQINNGTLTTAQDRYFFHIYGTRLSVSSNISGAGKELVKSGPGELVLYGSQGNTYTGTTYVHEGTLVLNKSPNARVVGNIIVGDGGGTDSLRLDQSHQIDDLAIVRLKGASRAKNMTAQGVLQFNGAGGVGLTEKIHTLEIEGQGVINFAGGSLARPNVLETMRVLMPTADDTLFIRNWIEYADYFLVSRAFAPDAAVLSRIWFEGWAPGAKLINYNPSHWEIVPYSSPEPATYGAILGAVGVGLWGWKRRSCKRAKPPYPQGRICSSKP